jgi:hypothetical protein
VVKQLYLFFSFFYDNILIITIKNLTMNWFSELEKFEKLFNFQKIKKKVLKSSSTDEKINKTFDEFCKKKINILVLTPTMYNNIKEKKKIDLLIIDELTEIKYFDLFVELKCKKLLLSGTLFNNKIKKLNKIFNIVDNKTTEEETTIINKIDSIFLKTINNEFDVKLVKNFIFSILKKNEENIIILNKCFFYNFLEKKNKIKIEEYSININLNDEQIRISNESFSENIKGNILNQSDISMLMFSDDLYKSKKIKDYDFQFKFSPVLSIIYDIIKYSINEKKNILVLSSSLDVLFYIRIILTLNIKKLNINESDIYIFNGNNYNTEISRLEFFKHFNSLKRTSILLFSHDLAIGVNVSNVSTIIETGLNFLLNLKYL